MKSKNLPLIVPVFLPHAGCPHQCVFCNQRAVTGTSQAIPTLDTIQKAMETYASHRVASTRPVQIAFYGGNFLGLPKEIIISLLSAATGFIKAGRANSIRFSTRPDTVNDESLMLISTYPVSTVEIGVQSMSDRVLSRSRRGHRAVDTINAMQLLKKTDVEIGIQMMVGLPGDDAKTSLASGHAVALLAPSFARIYPTLVLAGSPLARRFTQGRYHPLDLARAVNITKRLLALFHHHDIPVIRMGLQASAELGDGSSVMAGPYHPAFGHLVYEALFFDAIIKQFSVQPPDGIACLMVHPRNISTLRGLNNRNIKYLTDQFQLYRLTIETDVSLPSGIVVVNDHPCRLYETHLDADMTDAGMPCD